MNRMLRVKLGNILRTEANKTMEEEKNLDVKLSKMNDLFNLKKILDNYDELEPTLRQFFIEKARKEKFENQERE